MTPELLRLVEALISGAATLGGAKMIARALAARLRVVETVQETHAARLDKVEAHNAAQDERIGVLESQTGLIR